MVDEATLDFSFSHSNCWCYRFPTGDPLGLTCRVEVRELGLALPSSPRLLTAQYSSDSPGGVETRPGSHGLHFG